MCTYNGSRYLREQLDSIADQSRPPDELVVCDDRSDDDTIEIVRGFADGAVFPVILHENQENLGSTRNFERAIEKCTGDVIALCDQDDFWMPHKLKRIESEFNATPDAGLIFSNALLTDENLKPLGIDLWRETFSRRDRRKFRQGKTVDVFLQYNVITGATMAFRSSLRPCFLPIPELTDFIHDGWIGLALAISSKLHFIDEPLLKYRQHSDQQLGVVLSRWQIPLRERIAANIDRRQRSLIRLEELKKALSPERLERMIAAGSHRSTIDHAQLSAKIAAASAHIRSIIRHYEFRASLPSIRIARFPRIAGEFLKGRYSKFSSGIKSAGLDLVGK